MSISSSMTVRQRLNRLYVPIIFRLVDEDGTGNKFETDQPLSSATPSLSITATTVNFPIKHFVLEEVRYYFAATNSVTFELYLLEKAESSAVARRSYVGFDSGSGKLRDTMYLSSGEGWKLPVVMNLDEENKIYYMIDWSGAPGNTPGYIVAKGWALK